MRNPLTKALLFAGMSVALGAGAAVGLTGAASGDGGASWDHSEKDRSWDKSCHRSYENYGSSTDAEGKRDGLKAIGLTADQQLVTFAVERPGGACEIGQVTLADDEYLVGIDYRVQNGKLYGVGDQGGIYTLSAHDASSAKVSQLTVALEGEYFGVDFNPAADRLRVISNTGQNLRHNVNDNTTIEDGDLTYPPATAIAQGVTGAAYTNNDLGPDTATTLFDIDTNLDQVAVQSPANTGQLAATGKLGVDAGPWAGFDIYSTVRNATTVYNKGFAVLQVNDHSNVYQIDMLTGHAEKQGTFAHHRVVDLALPLNQL